MRWSAEYALVRTHMALGRFTDARARLDRLRSNSSVANENPVRLDRVLIAARDLARSTNDPLAERDALERLVELRKTELFSPDAAATAMLDLAAAVTRDTGRQPDVAFLRSALTIATEGSGSGSRIAGRAHTMLAEACASRGDIINARHHARLAIELAKSHRLPVALSVATLDQLQLTP